MKQGNKNLVEMPNNQINRLVTEEFLAKVDQLVDMGLTQNVSAFATLLGVDRSVISKLRGDKNRYIGLAEICKAVNLLGLNANSIFVTEGNNAENVIREGVHINSSGSGNTNNIVQSKGTKIVQGSIIHGDNHGKIITAEKIIQGLPSKERKAMKAVLDSIQNSNGQMAGEIKRLKKMIDKHKKEMEMKEKELKEVKDKYTALLEKRAGVKK